MNTQSMFLDGEILGAYLASVFCLNRQYFAQAFQGKYKVNVEMRSLHGFIFVKVPKEIRELLDNGFIASKIEKEDQAEYTYRFELSKDCTIGFWK